MAPRSSALLAALKAEQAKLSQTARQVHAAGGQDRARPVAWRTSERIARTLVAHRIDGVIATNTTTDRSAVGGSARTASEAGGLSGAPLQAKVDGCGSRAARMRSTARCRSSASAASCRARTRGRKSRAGATLVQIYTGLIYRGPQLSSEIAEALAQR